MGIGKWRVPGTVGLVSLALMALTSAARAQCHPGVIGGTAPAGPGHTSRQLLRYDADGSGPENPVLVSVGMFGETLAHGVRALDYGNQSWYSLGGASMQIDLVGAGVTYGTSAEDEGPFLAVTAGLGSLTGNLTSYRFNRVYCYDGEIWRRLPDVPGYSSRAITSFDPDGDGPRDRTLVVLMDWYSPLGDDGASLSQVMMLEGNAWRAMGKQMLIRRVAGLGDRLIAWDPDGQDGPAGEALFMSAALHQEGGAYQPQVLRLVDSGWEPLAVSVTSITNLRVMDLDGEGPNPARLAVIGGVVLEDPPTNAPMAFFDGEEWLPLVSPGVSTVHDAVMCDDGSVFIAHRGNGGGLRRVSLENGNWITHERVDILRNGISYTPSLSLACIPDGELARGYRLFGSQFNFTYTGSGPALADQYPVRVGEIPPIPPEPNAYLTYFLSTPGRGFNGPVADARVLADGGLLVVGGFTSVDGVLSPFTARRDSAGQWQSMSGPLFRDVPVIAGELRDGRILVLPRLGLSTPSRLYQYDGETWSPYTDLGFEFSALRVFESDDGVLTFINFVRRDIAMPTSCGIMQVRGGEMIPVACTGAAGTNSVVMNDGSVITTTSTVAGVPAFETGLARWDGVEWTALGEGNGNYAGNLRMLPDGTLVGIKDANRISRWNGVQWVVDPVDANGRNVTLESFEVVGDDTFFGRGTITSLPGYYEPRTGTLGRSVYIHGTYWEDPIFDIDSFYDQPTKGVAMPDGTTLVIGHLRLNGSFNPYTHFGLYQLSACNTCSACIADWDESGGVDAMDVAAFFVDYEQGNRCADVDDSTGVDGTDMALFFAAYEAGGC